VLFLLHHLSSVRRRSDKNENTKEHWILELWGSHSELWREREENKTKQELSSFHSELKKIMRTIAM
jgi:hypothetical protein